MDEQLKETFERAKKELIHLNFRWAMYLQLFGTNSHRISIINQTASNLLAEFQWLVVDNMVLSLSKFTDPAQMRGFINLSFNYLIEEIKKTDKAEITEELKKILEQLNNASDHFRKIRNKRIAHNDLATALGSDESPLPGVSRADVNQALKMAGDFLNKIELAFLNSSTLYDMTILLLQNDGRSVLIRLQKSLAYDQLVDAGIVDVNKWREFGDIDERPA